jgi:hypothetical protein
MNEDDVAAAVISIKDCLRLDPQKRLMAKECTRYDWVVMTMTNVSAKGEGEKWLWNV